MKAFNQRYTLPLDQHTGQIFKIEMRLKHNNNKLTIVNMGAHLLTNEDTYEVTICQFNGKPITYAMGHTFSSPASLKEIADWATVEMVEANAIIEADYEREMLEEEFLQRSGNIY